MTKDFFIKNLPTDFLTKYDYSLLPEKFTGKEKIEIICNIHGKFTQVSGNHLYNKYGCKQCGYDIQSKNNLITTTNEDIIKKFINIFGDTYNYNKVVFKTKKDLIKVDCKIHGEFLITVNSHLKGKGCTQCEKEKNKFSKEFILNFLCSFDNITLYPDKCFYNKCDKVIIKNNNKIIFDNQVRKLFNNKNIFLNSVESILENKTEKTKYEISPIIKFLSKEDKTQFFIKKASMIHNDKYSYEKSIFNKTSEKIIITCPIHGDFEQRYEEHINKKHGCKQCGILNGLKSSNREFDKNNFLEKVNKKFNNNYIYHFTENEKFFKDKIEIECKQHKIKFIQTISEHFNSSVGGCPVCSKRISGMELFVRNFLISNNIEFLVNDKTLIGKELDIVIPELKIAIELNGNRFHSDLFLEHTKARKSSINKYNLCKEIGYDLLSYFEDEIYYGKKIKELKINFINHLMSKLKLIKETLNARSCSIKEIDKKIANEFLNQFHLQGESKGKFYIGLFSNNKLVSVMIFNSFNSIRGTVFNGNDYELVRFATSSNVRGAAGKLLKYFIKNYNPKTIISYSDNRYSNGNLYLKLGFKKENDIKEDYYYVSSNDSFSKRYHKTFLKKSNQQKKFSNYNPNKTEYENARNNNFYRIWDCGKIKWKLEIL